jgi:hypothetical protein
VHGPAGKCCRGNRNHRASHPAGWKAGEVEQPAAKESDQESFDEMERLCGRGRGHDTCMPVPTVMVKPRAGSHSQMMDSYALV